MRKNILIALAAITAIVTVGCDNTYTSSELDSFPYEVEDFIDLRIIRCDFDSYIYVDSNTDILYYRYTGGYQGAMTAILKPDGTPLTLSEFKENHSSKQEKK